MSIRNVIIKASALFIFILINPLSVYAGEFQCSIKNVLKLSDTGSFATHGWSANYLNREFTVERETGKVIMTTALKVRLSNFDRDHSPQLLSSGDNDDVFKAITVFEKKGQYALLQINKTIEGNPRPFFYHTGIDMILTGVCADKP